LVIFSILGPLPALGSPHAAKRFIGLAIVVRGKDRVASHHRALGHNFICARTLQRTLPAGFHRAVPFTPRSQRLHHNVLATALANKLARIAWTVLVQGRSYEARVTSGTT
jgi:hypothetical protein